MALFQEMLATPPPAVKQKKKRKQTLCNDAQQPCTGFHVLSMPLWSVVQISKPWAFLGRLDPASKANENLCVDYNGQTCCEGEWRTAEQRRQLQLMKAGVGI